MIERMYSKDLDGGVWQLLFAYLDCNQVQPAKALAEVSTSLQCCSRDRFRDLTLMLK